jgi:heme-degrading monooxygenase HmoA
MFIAMNRFHVIKGHQADFEHVWLSRDTYLDNVPGFVEFGLLKGPEFEEYTLYASHTVWESRAAFEAWTGSEAFRAAHQQAGEHKPLHRTPAIREFRCAPGGSWRYSADRSAARCSITRSISRKAAFTSSPVSSSPVLEPVSSAAGDRDLEANQEFTCARTGLRLSRTEIGKTRA